MKLVTFITVCAFTFTLNVASAGTKQSCPDNDSLVNYSGKVASVLKQNPRKPKTDGKTQE